MPGNSGVLADVAGAILDGTPIDWASAESSAEEIDRALLEPLRIVAAVADLHRRLPPRSGTSPVSGQSASDPLVQQEHWGHLRVLERVGRGTFGRVYRAWDTRLDREVALKLLPAGPTASDARTTSIIEEGRLLARVRHPNVVSIYGAERIGEQIGLWMEFVDGHTLEQLLQQGRVFDQKEAVAIGIQLCQAVAAVHQAGLLHRDIKAHNVMLTNENRVVLMDFGTGRALGDRPAASIAGTPLYLAPEVLAGGETTVASDIYGMGVLFYHLLTGVYPVQASDLATLRSAHERGDRADLVAARPDLSSKLVRIIQRAIDPQPARRPHSAATLASNLESLRPRSKLIPLAYAVTVAATLALVVWIASDFRSRNQSGSVASAADGGAPSHAEQPIIAVLPLTNLSSEPDSDYLVDGLTDEIIRNLAGVRGLQVRSRTSSFAFKNKPRNLREVGQLLGANLVVEGSVLRSGNHLRINAQLVQVAGDVPLWSDRFTRELKDVFLIQDEISRAIVNKLRLTLGRGQRRYDLDPDAYALYVKARALADRRGPKDPQAAVAMFEQVIARDPSFAPAYAGLVNAYASMSMSPYGGVSFRTAQSIMRPAALKAVDLDPLLAEAHAAMGWVSSRDFDWEKAEKSFRHAIELNPSLTQIYSDFSASTLRTLGRFDEAEQLMQAAREIDPLSLDVLREIGQLQFLAGRYVDAITTLQHVYAADPDLPFVDMFLGRSLVFAGRVAEAIPMLGRNVHYAAHAYVRAGRRAEVEKLAVTHAGYPQRLAVIYAALEDKDRTLAMLERMIADEPHRAAINLGVPEFAFLQGDPRLAALRKRLNLPRDPAAFNPSERPIIAVLPFKNLSSEAGSDYFVDGLTDELIRNLAVIEGLAVRSQTSSFFFKDKPRNLREVGELLGANLVVEGSVLRSGNQLRINAQLVPVSQDVPVWSGRFNRELKDIFAIQDEISLAIVNKLRLTLGRGQRRYELDPEAYALYLKGRALVGRKGVPALEEAAGVFEAAVARDPAFAPAHAGLAIAYALMSTPTGSTLPFATAHAVLRPAAVKALELDPLLADAHAAMGWVHARERNWTDAEHAFQRAIALNPSLTESYTGYSSSTLAPRGKDDEALAVLRSALQNDPLSLDVERMIGGVQLHAGNFAEAIETLRRVVAADPGFPFAAGWLGRALMYAGRLEEAVPLLEKSDGRNLGRFRPGQSGRTPYLAYLYVATGRRADAVALLADHKNFPSSLAVIYAALGDKDRTFEALEQVAAVRPHHVGPLLKNPEMAVLRGDPRLTALRERFGLPISDR